MKGQRAASAGLPPWFNIVAAFLGWSLIAPLLGLIALLIRMDSPGPAVFRQSRIGKDGKPFTMYKFRTMRRDPAGAKGADYEAPVDFQTFIFTPDSRNPRVTRIGEMLRRTSLDEMLQLINVALGDMAIVGPRPEIPEIVRQYPPKYHVRHRTPPGITGLAQVRGRADLTYAETIRYDLGYVKRRSPRLDLAILARTVSVVLRGTGAR